MWDLAQKHGRVTAILSEGTLLAAGCWKLGIITKYLNVTWHLLRHDLVHGADSEGAKQGILMHAESRFGEIRRVLCVVRRVVNAGLKLHTDVL